MACAIWAFGLDRWALWGILKHPMIFDMSATYTAPTSSAAANAVTCPSCHRGLGTPDAITEERLLAAARVLSPLLFKYGLQPQPGWGPKTSQRMADEIDLVRRILEAR